MLLGEKYELFRYPDDTFLSESFNVFFNILILIAVFLYLILKIIDVLIL